MKVEVSRSRELSEQLREDFENELQDLLLKFCGIDGGIDYMVILPEGQSSDDQRYGEEFLKKLNKKQLKTELSRLNVEFNEKDTKSKLISRFSEITNKFYYEWYYTNNTYSELYNLFEVRGKHKHECFKVAIISHCQFKYNNPDFFTNLYFDLPIKLVIDGTDYSHLLGSKFIYCKSFIKNDLNESGLFSTEQLDEIYSLLPINI